MTIDKVTRKSIEQYVEEYLGKGYHDKDLHSDDIDNAAYGAAQAFEVDEDEVRYICNLPR